MTKQQSDAEIKFYMKQANIIVDLLLELLPPIYYDVFKDDFDLFMRDLWISDGEHEPIFSELLLKEGETIQTLEQTNWNALSKEKKMEWLEKFDLQALLKSICFREDSLKLFCKKNALAYYNLKSVFITMTQWRNYGVGHKSTSKYKEMDKSIFAEIILAPANDLCDQLRREYKQECEMLKDTLKDIRIRMKYPETSISRLIYLTNIPEETVREVLKILKVDVGSDETIFGEDEEELVDSIKRLSEKDSVKKNEKDDRPSDLLSKIKNRDKKTIGILAGALLLLLLVIILLAQCGNGGAEKKKSEKETSTEETTTDNRKVIDPFKNMKVEENIASGDENSDYSEEEASVTDPNYLPVNIKILNDKQNEIQYDIVECYDNEADYEADKEQWDNDALFAGEEKNTEDETDEYGESLDEDYFKNRNHGQILIIQVKQVTVNNHPDIKYAGNDGKTYYKYVVKGVEIIKTASHLNTINRKSLKVAEKKGKSAVIKLASGNPYNKISNIKMIGYYVSLPPENQATEEDNESSTTYLYLIYKTHVDDGVWTEDIINKDCYCCYKMEDPIYKKNAICAKDGSYGEIQTETYGEPILDKYTFYPSIKELYNTYINQDEADYGNDIYPYHYGNNKEIKKY